MRLTGNKFIPGIRIEVKEDEPEEKKPGKVEILDQLAGLKISTTEVHDEADEDLRPPADDAEAAEGEADQEYSYESATESFETYTSKQIFFLSVVRCVPTLSRVLFSLVQSQFVISKAVVLNLS